MSKTKKPIIEHEIVIKEDTTTSKSVAMMLFPVCSFILFISGKYAFPNSELIQFFIMFIPMYVFSLILYISHNDENEVVVHVIKK